jgi:bifunctional non-homologous end joining protein LigD
MPGQPASIRQIAISGRERPYLMVEDAEGLQALAQLSVMEIHPWGALGATPDQPERLVFDIDPPDGTGFEPIVAAAIELRARLDALGLRSFARISGGKGVHVVVPLAQERGKARLGWEEAKVFARTICVQMEQDTPALYTTAIRKAARRGRIFLDFLRNDREATAIASWSPRARPGAPLAQPLSWQALRRHRPADRLTLRAALGVRLIDPWKGFEDARSSLRDAIARLLKT